MLFNVRKLRQVRQNILTLPLDTKKTPENSQVKFDIIRKEKKMGSGSLKANTFFFVYVEVYSLINKVDKYLLIQFIII